MGLTVGLKRGGTLLSILVLPLTIPLLIFATAAMDAASMHLPVAVYGDTGRAAGGQRNVKPSFATAALRVSLH